MAGGGRTSAKGGADERPRATAEGTWPRGRARRAASTAAGIGRAPARPASQKLGLRREGRVARRELAGQPSSRRANTARQADDKVGTA